MLSEWGPMDWFTQRINVIGPIDWHFQVLGVQMGGRALYLAVLATGLLLVTAPIALRLGGEIRTRWVTWALILPAVGLPIWAGRRVTTVLAILLALGAVREYVVLGGLARWDARWLYGCSVLLPLVTLASEVGSVGEGAGWVPWLILGGAALPLLAGDVTDGFRRAAMTAFGVVWLCWSLANLSLLGPDTFVILFAAAFADVGAFVAGKSLRRFSWAGRSLTPLSPNKTWGGVVGALICAALILLACGAFSWAWVLAVGVGGIMGDLLESMLKRQQQVKDAGSWLPGFGGLLDRIDSLLIAIPLAVLLY